MRYLPILLFLASCSPKLYDGPGLKWEDIKPPTVVTETIMLPGYEIPCEDSIVYVTRDSFIEKVVLKKQFVKVPQREIVVECDDTQTNYYYDNFIDCKNAFNAVVRSKNARIEKLEDEITKSRNEIKKLSNKKTPFNYLAIILSIVILILLIRGRSK